MKWVQSWDGYGGCCQLTEDRRQRGELHLPCSAGRHTMLLSDLCYTTDDEPHVTYRRIVYRRSCKQRIKIIHTGDAVLNMLETTSGLMHTHQHMCACTDRCYNAECTYVNCCAMARLTALKALQVSSGCKRTSSEGLTKAAAACLRAGRCLEANSFCWGVCASSAVCRASRCCTT